VATRLLGTLGRPDVHMDEIAEIVLQDPAVAGQVLRAANSAALSGRVKVETISEALRRLGVSHLRRLAVLVCARNTLPVDGALFPHEAFWAHSLAVGHATEVVLRRIASVPADTVPEILFLGGLLHDVGLLALASFYPEEYRSIVREADARATSFYETEMAELGGGHGEMGAMLASHWMLPEALVAAMRHHHHPRRAEREHRFTVRVVHLADHLASRALGEFPHGTSEHYDDATPAALGVETSGSFRMCAEIRAEARRVAFTWLGD
jgi:HD-like signal output (HDOD) protein